ncbi:unnamed protein product [Trifolium pratense]|uniref:Uncharacterized protein n=1 Tax=Trifolium pratense TaxID=57577 RepID=A0ACB0JFJ8_TRIPR|nr:unnamed protein product [Trifolium pratense]
MNGDGSWTQRNLQVRKMLRSIKCKLSFILIGKVEVDCLFQWKQVQCRGDMRYKKIHMTLAKQFYHLFFNCQDATLYDLRAKETNIESL